METLAIEDWFDDLAFPFKVIKTDQEYDYPEHRHHFFEFLLVTRGKLRHTLDGFGKVLEPGDIVMLSPARKHALELVAGEPMETFQVLFMPSVLGVGTDVYREEKHLAELVFMLPFYEKGCLTFRLSGKTHLKIKSLLDELFDEYTNRQRGYKVAIRAKLTDLLITISRAYENDSRKRAGGDKISATAEAVLNSLSYIDNNFREELRLEDVAESTAGVSKEYFSTIFHNLMGTTFSQYLINLRVELAKRLLNSTDEKILSVCYDSGFKDLSHFNRTFKKVTGFTPSEFRKREAI